MTAARIPWFNPVLTGKELPALAEVLDSNFLNDGPVTRQLEEAFERRLQVRHAVAVTSGTAGLALALMAAGVGSGDEVIVPDLTFAATANAARLAGATVRLVDVDTSRLTMDPHSLAQAIGPRTRAVIPVDVNGRSADYASILRICREHGIPVICDSAEALGSDGAGGALGTVGLAGCFSLSPAKTITSGQGGVVVTNDSRLHDRIRELKDQGRRTRGTGGDDLHPAVGFNFKYTDLQAAVALAQFAELDDRLERSRWRHTAYVERLQAAEAGLRIPRSHPGEVVQWTDVIADDRDAVRTQLEMRGIGYRPFWHPLHTQTPYLSDPALFPRSSEISRSGMWLPSSLNISDREIHEVVAALLNALPQGDNGLG